MKTIALLHGWGFTPEIWNPLRAELKDFQLLTPDLTNDGATLTARADTLAAAIETKVILVGWSLGAMLAIQLAQRHPSKVMGLCLISATQRFVTDSSWPHGLAPEVVSSFLSDFSKNPGRTIKRFLALQVLGDANRQNLQPQLEASLAGPDTSGLPDGLQILETADLRSMALPETMPILLIHGAQDALMPIEAARALRNAFPSANLLEIPDAGHCPLFSETAQLADLIRNFALEC